MRFVSVAHFCCVARYAKSQIGFRLFSGREIIGVLFHSRHSHSKILRMIAGSVVGVFKVSKVTCALVRYVAACRPREGLQQGSVEEGLEMTQIRMRNPLLRGLC